MINGLDSYEIVVYKTVLLSHWMRSDPDILPTLNTATMFSYLVPWYEWLFPEQFSDIIRYI